MKYWDEETALTLWNDRANKVSLNNLTKLIYLVVEGVYQKNHHKLDDDDKQDHILAILKTLDKFQPDRKSTLFNFVTKLAQNHMYWAYSKKKRDKSKLQTVSLEEYIEKGGVI